MILRVCYIYILTYTHLTVGDRKKDSRSYLKNSKAVAKRKPEIFQVSTGNIMKKGAIILRKREYQKSVMQFYLLHSEPRKKLNDIYRKI